LNIQILTIENLDLLVEFEQEARRSEPDIFAKDFDPLKFRAGTEEALKNPLFASARCLICVGNEGKIIGRIDFSTIPSLSFGGNLRAYIDWIYVLKNFRHHGAAQFLLAHAEAYIKGMGIEEYFLLMAENEEAQSFYRNVAGAEISSFDVLRKTLLPHGNPI